MDNTIRFSLAALLAIPACSGMQSDMNSGEMAYNSSNLESGNCGQENNASNPSTGDADEDNDSATNADSDADDDSGEGGEDATRSQVATSKHVVLQVLWGNLMIVGSPSSSTAWNGKLSVAGGAKLKLLRTIRFEANDAITSETETEINWTSSTQPKYDGVQVLVGLPENAASASLTFATAPYSVTYSGEELIRLRAVATVGTEGNAVSIRALPLGRCQHGFMRGHWTRVDAKGGVFRGQWIRANGKAKGFVEGIWGVRLSGEQVFFGRIVSRDGKNRGTVFGHYDAGMYRGHWARNGKVRGVIRGHAVDANADGRGFFAGEWLRFCSAYRRCEASVDASASAAGAIATTGNATDLSFEASGDVTVSATCQ
ncbi:MAG: hypothetical protein HYY84_06985 [Deltaproteobacteria bacterium]|nr:hypothetical protein [Deltaproteobacteria bacterium]